MSWLWSPGDRVLIQALPFVWQSHLTLSVSVSQALYQAELVRIKSINTHSRVWGSEDQFCIMICTSAWMEKVRSGIRIALPKVTRCDVNRDKIRILKPPTPKITCVFKLLATIEAFLKIKTHKYTNYTKQITSHTYYNY